MNELQQTAHKAWASLLTALAGMLSMPDANGVSPFGVLVRSGIYALYSVPVPPRIDLANATYAVVWALFAAAVNGSITYLVPNQVKTLTPLQKVELAAPGIGHNGGPTLDPEATAPAQQQPAAPAASDPAAPAGQG